MNHWIFTTTEQKVSGRIYKSEEIYQCRMSDEFWGLGQKTPNRQALEAGDQAVFYVGIPHKAFFGIATLKTASFELNAMQRDRVGHGTDFYRAPFGVELDAIQTWAVPHKVEDLVGGLEFIENKKSWRSYFQGGIRHVSEEDFRRITTGEIFSVSPHVHVDRGLESAAEFALESHLEDFIDKNWKSIDFGCKLRLFKTDDQGGRQYPAGPWSIDFLCTDEANNDFVVIELKRGQTSDATVGQIQRYIGWVQENLASRGQTVRGIIIAKEFDESLRYSIRSLPHVKVMSYKVDFKLLEPRKLAAAN